MSSFLVFFVTTILAMLPVIELRGAIPIGMSFSLWGENALNLIESVIASIIGGILVCFLVVAIFFPLKKLLSRVTIFRNFFDFFDKKATEQLARFHKKSKQKLKQENSRTTPTMPAPTPQLLTNTRQIIFSEQKIKKLPKNHQKIENLRKCIFVFLFCAIPLPFTGVWSAGALCSLLGIGFWQSVCTLIFANLVSSGIIALFCLIFQNYIDLVLVIMAIIFVMIVLYALTKMLSSRRKIKDNSTFCD